MAKDNQFSKGHNPENENGISNDEGYTCNRCGKTFKTMGFFKKQMKSQHDINISSTPPIEDGARSLPQQRYRNYQKIGSLSDLR